MWAGQLWEGDGVEAVCGAVIALLLKLTKHESLTQTAPLSVVGRTFPFPLYGNM